tara:strand:+ start:127 stop:525 length:399 start_codon:yes stop_codon:yes gene_type:complete
MAEQGRNKPRGRALRDMKVPDKVKRKKRRAEKMALPMSKPTKRQRKEYHNRADTLGDHLDQVMNPGRIYQDPGEGPGLNRRVIPSLTEIMRATGRFAGDKIKGMRGMSAGGSLKTKGIDGIAQRGKTRAKRK